MEEQRVRANGEVMLGPVYEVPDQPDAYDVAHKIVALARIGIAASDSPLNIDLTKKGYLELLEVIAQLASEICEMIPDLELKAKGELQ